MNAQNSVPFTIPARSVWRNGIITYVPAHIGWSHRSGPSTASQPALEASCEYCTSQHRESRCPSCGAPRRAKSFNWVKCHEFASNAERLHPELP
jgi:hypothetical protein